MKSKNQIAKHIRRPVIVALVVSALAISLSTFQEPVVRAGSGGTLDTSFGTGGRVNTDIAGQQDDAFALAFQTDGKIVVAGRTNTASASFDFALVRYNTDGSMDTTFGTSGKVTTDFSGFRDEAFALAIQSDGKIVVAGTAGNSGAGTDYALARYDSSGNLDSGFGTGGKVKASLSANDDEIYAIAIQTDGKLVAVGEANVNNINSNMGVVRFNSNGTLDSGFGTGGTAITDYFGSQDRGRAIAILPSGKILVAGSAMTPTSTIVFALAEFSSAGALDGSFGSGGKVTTVVANSDFARALVVQPDNKIVVGGNSSYNTVTNNDYALARYNSDGSLDGSFGAGGLVRTHFTGESADTIHALALQTDGKIVAAGVSSPGSFAFGNTGDEFSLARYNPDGTLDGKIETDFAGLNDGAQAIGIQPNGRIVAAGTAKMNGTNAGQNFGLVRYLNIHSTVLNRPLGDFDGDGKTDVAVFRPSEGRWYGLYSGDNSFHFFLFGTSADRPVPADYDGDGKTDLAYLSGATSWTIRQSTNGSLLQYGLGVAGDRPVPADYNGNGAAEAAVFRPSIGVWFELAEGSTGSGNRSQAWGNSTDLPVPGDYDGDGQTDFAVFRPGDGSWYILRSSSFTVATQAWGTNGDRPVAGDYDGDQKTDVAVWRPSEGYWYILRSATGSYQAVSWGNNSLGDQLVPGDYDGDHKTDVAVFRAGAWYWLQSSDGAFRNQLFGQSGDIPIPATYLPVP